MKKKKGRKFCQKTYNSSSSSKTVSTDEMKTNNNDISFKPTKRRRPTMDDEDVQRMNSSCRSNSKSSQREKQCERQRLNGMHRIFAPAQKKETQQTHLNTVARKLIHTGAIFRKQLLITNLRTKLRGKSRNKQKIRGGGETKTRRPLRSEQ